LANTKNVINGSVDEFPNKIRNKDAGDCVTVMSLRSFKRMTPWSRVLSEKLRGPQLVQKFPKI